MEDEPHPRGDEGEVFLRFPHLNETLDRFVAKALACNVPITFVNHAEGPHAFDLFHDSETSREIIREILRFLRFHLDV